MFLFETEIQSGSIYAALKTIYVVAESYAHVEKILKSDNNQYWEWNHGQKIKSIKEINIPVMIQNRR